eukprot:CAMPEP_0180666042 /NCGR_PEP_ID=MMETSP1037_2-20121125/61603_1 /TAXON_ID=632150 /ORGANISM="Azadinium spinosum, Strain 3D9" /LENGTH=58 /DNA_ID=CAMNT_0022694523 /DNA_START=29 /DNA_END=203 /DNA_ORIENTATION=+
MSRVAARSEQLPGGAAAKVLQYVPALGSCAARHPRGASAKCALLEGQELPNVGCQTAA